MCYDFQGTGEVPDLEDFKIRLAKQLMRSSFFQDEVKEDFDMLRQENILLFGTGGPIFFAPDSSLAGERGLNILGMGTTISLPHRL